MTPPPFAPAPVDDDAPIERPRSWGRDALEVVLIAFVLYIIIWNALQTVRVDGVSMTDTLANQDLLLASKISYHLHDPERGDIVILIPPISQPAGNQQDFIKRIVGIPGDHIEIVPHHSNPAGADVPTAVMIKPGGAGSWQRLNEPYRKAEYWDVRTSCCTSDGKETPDHQAAEVTIPADSYFVMGDNRNGSEDSRVFGWVKKDAILAKAFVRIWPFLNFGLGPGGALVPTAPTAAVLLVPGLYWGRRRRRRRQRSGRVGSRGASEPLSPRQQPRL